MKTIITVSGKCPFIELIGAILPVQRFLDNERVVVKIYGIGELCLRPGWYMIVNP